MGGGVGGGVSRTVVPLMAAAFEQRDCRELGHVQTLAQVPLLLTVHVTHLEMHLTSRQLRQGENTKCRTAGLEVVTAKGQHRGLNKVTRSVMATNIAPQSGG